MRRAISWATAGLLVVSLGLAIVAWYLNPDFDRASIAVALLAGIAGLVIDRHLSAFERRRDLLRALLYELFVVQNIFRTQEMDPATIPTAPQAYPHFPHACLDTCLASGAFTEAQDTALLKAMYEWRQRCTEFNEKLLLTGPVGLSASADVLASYHRSVTASNTTALARETLTALYSHLLDHYPRVTDITRSSTAFGPSAG